MSTAGQPASELQSHMDLVVSPTLVLDSKAQILAANDALYALVQAEPGSLEGKPVDDILYPGDRKAVHRFTKTLPKKATSPEYLEARLRTREEIVVWSLLSAGKKKVGSADVITIHVQEIQGLRNLQDRLEYAEEFLRSVGSLVEMGTWSLDLDSHQLYWSPETYEIHEMDRSLQPKLEDAIQFYAPEARDSIREAMESCIKEGTRFDITLPLITAKGKRIHVRAMGEVEKRDGKAVRLYGVFQDVTEQAETQEQLLRLKDGMSKAQRVEALGIMTSGIAHDFNNINASIQGNAEILASRLNDDHSKDLMADIIDGCGHARNLVHRILAFTRNEQKEVREKVAPHLIISRAVSMTRPLAKEEVDIEHDVPQDFPEISVDAYQVEEALVNLIYNSMQALDHVHHKGKIRITLSLEDVAAQDGYRVPLPGHYVVVGVEDNGPGISKDVIKDIFKPFFTTKSDDNVGLGLAMVQEVMKSHGGAVTVDHDRKKGAFFQLYFPVDAGASIRDKEKQQQKARILLIDDEAAFLKMMERALNSFGYRVRSFRSPLDGLKVFQEESDAFDLVITDLDLPWLDGNAVAKQVRELNSSIPIILVSGCNWKLESPDSNFQHFAGVLTKPFSLEDLQGKIVAALGTPSPKNSP
jgi:signal transduction histidine kinase